MIPLLLLAGALISGAALARLALILGGMHKGPLLQLFEKYGDDENRFRPLPASLLWSSILVICSRELLAGVLFIPRVVSILGLLTLLVAYVLYQRPPPAPSFSDDRRFRTLPVWYDRLMRTTSREDRRHIAYMWLRLPLRLRLLYNTNDQAFFHWADLVAMATLR